MVNRSRDLASTIIAPLLLLLCAAGGAAAAPGELREPTREPARPQSVETVGEPARALHPAQGGDSTESAESAGSVAGPAFETGGARSVQLVEEPDTVETGDDLAGEVPRPEEERQVDVLEQKGGSLGYSQLLHDGYRGRALEYGLLQSSRTGGLFYRNLQRESNLELEGYLLNRHDYHADLLVDYLGDYRLHLRTESLFHNLDRELLFTTPFPLSDSAGVPANYRPVQDPPTDYGLSVVQDRAEFRYRLHNYPLHLNLGYWKLAREGTIQQRFADHSFEGVLNRVFAQPRDIEHRTHEGRLGLDAHLGPVDVIYDFKVRVFDDRNPTPVEDFDDRGSATLPLERVGGLHQHNENPDSRFFSHTVKLHSSLAGGLVGSGSYSIDQRENLSRLSDTSGAKHMKVHLHNAAGDLTYSPAREYTMALKYRRQELDHSGRGPILSNNFVDPVQLVKPPMDSTKDLVIATLTYRPRTELSLTGEYRGEFLKRSNVSELPSPVSWTPPGHSDSHTGSLALYYRPVKGMRTSASYSYASTNNPSYGASFQERHEGKLLASYTRSTWGVTANAVLRREWNDEVERFLLASLDPLDYTPYPLRNRDRRTENSNLGVWVAPLPGLTLGANYAYLSSRVGQPVLFTAFAPASEAASRFTSRSHVFGVNATYSASELFDLSLMLQQVHSDAEFVPESTVFSPTSDTSGIEELTRQRTVISSLSARGEYRFTKALSGLMEYALKDYNEKDPAYSETSGTVHVIVASVTAKW